MKALNKFCSWFDTVFEDEHSHITVDYIKKLFSSGFEIHPAAQSIYIEPKQVFSIPHEMAEKYNVPEVIIPLNTLIVLILLILLSVVDKKSKKEMDESWQNTPNTNSNDQIC